MLEEIMKMDAKGIIPDDRYVPGIYLSNGNAVLHESMKLKIEYALGKDVNLQGIKAKRAVMPKPVSDAVMEKYKTDVSWVPVFEANDLGSRLGSTGVGRASEIYHNGKRVPVLLYTDGDDSTLNHEAVHFIRDFARYAGNEAFEEAMADSGKFTLYGFSRIFKRWKCASVINAARKNLENCFGLDADYVLVRLKRPEIFEISRNNNNTARQYLKDMGSLRHRIIKERLGL